MFTLRVGNLLPGEAATIRISLRRFPAASVPTDADLRLLWLFDRWVELDAWVGEAAA